MTFVDRRDRCLCLFDVSLDDRSDDLVFGLEVVVDVARGDIRSRCDFNERGALDTLSMQQLACGPVAGRTVERDRATHILDGQTHMVKPKALAPMLTEFFTRP